MKAMLLRVGIDTGYGGTLGPIFEDGSFEFVPIPELATDKWLDRCKFPLGMDDNGNFFELE